MRRRFDSTLTVLLLLIPAAVLAQYASDNGINGAAPSENSAAERPYRNIVGGVSLAITNPRAKGVSPLLPESEIPYYPPPPLPHPEPYQLNTARNKKNSHNSGLSKKTNGTNGFGLRALAFSVKNLGQSQAEAPPKPIDLPVHTPETISYACGPTGIIVQQPIPSVASGTASTDAASVSSNSNTKYETENANVISGYGSSLSNVPVSPTEVAPAVETAPPVLPSSSVITETNVVSGYEGESLSNIEQTSSSTALPAPSPSQSQVKASNTENELPDVTAEVTSIPSSGIDSGLGNSAYSGENSNNHEAATAISSAESAYSSSSSSSSSSSYSSSSSSSSSYSSSSSILTSSSSSVDTASTEPKAPEPAPTTKAPYLSPRAGYEIHNEVEDFHEQPSSSLSNNGQESNNYESLSLPSPGLSASTEATPQYGHHVEPSEIRNEGGADYEDETNTRHIGNVHASNEISNEVHPSAINPPPPPPAPVQPLPQPTYNIPQQIPVVRPRIVQPVVQQRVIQTSTYNAGPRAGYNAGPVFPQHRPLPQPFIPQQPAPQYVPQIIPSYPRPQHQLPPQHFGFPQPSPPQQLPVRQSPPGCCGGSWFSSQGSLCAPVNFNSCQQQAPSCGQSGCGAPRPACSSGCNPCGPPPPPCLPPFPCLPPLALPQMSCCCPPPSLCGKRKKRSPLRLFGLC